MKELTVQELKAFRENGNSHQLVDIREAWEVSVCSLNGTHIPMGEILNRLDELDKNNPVVMHCRSGGRSSKLVQFLETQHGMANLYNLKGGILAWADEIDQSLEKY